MGFAGIQMTMLVILPASPAVMLLFHMVLARISRNKSQQVIAVKSILAASLPTLVFLAAFVFRRIDSLSGLASALCYSFMVYGFLGMTYFHFFNMSETARRIRILYEIHRAGVLPSREVTSLYKTTMIVKTRLQRLVAMKQIKYEDGLYSIDRKTLYRAGLLVVFCRRMLGLEKYEE